MEADVVIIGGGLAGLSAAAEIASQLGNLGSRSQSRPSVMVVERRVVGSNNPTPMTFADVPARFGLDDCVIGRYTRFTFHSPLGNCASHDFDSQALVALAYQPACQALLARATSTGNVWLYSAAATGMVRQGGAWQIALNDGQSLHTRLVIDASGRGLFTSRTLDLPRPHSYSHCYGARLSGCNIPDSQEAFFFSPSAEYGDGGGWLYPLDRGQASFGYATLGSSPHLPGGVVKARFKRALAEFEPYATWLRGAEIDHVEVGTIPIYPLRRFVYDGLLIAGDAAGQATIWSCMGSEAALEAGRWAGAAAVDGLRRGDFNARTLASYQNTWDRRHRRTYRHNGWVAPVVWGMSAEEWNRQIPRVQSLEPAQMAARLRNNWPVPTLAQAVFVRAYDLAGRARRGLLHKVRRLREEQPGLKAASEQGDET